MKKILTLGLCLALGSSLLLMNSCKKLVDDASETTETAEDYADDQEFLNDLTDMVLDVSELDAQLKKGSSKYLPAGASIDWIDDDFNDGNGVVFIIDLGEVGENVEPDDETLGSLCADGNVRAGKMLISASKKLNEVGCVVKVELFGPWVIGTKKGKTMLRRKNSKEMTMTRLSSSKWELDYSLKIYTYFKKGKRKKFKKFRSTATGTFNMIQIAGLGTLPIEDDMYEVRGTADNENSGSKSYSVIIDNDNPLVRKGDPDCSNTFVSGNVEMKNSGSKFKLETDFGDGTCDNIVKVKINGVEKTITVE